VRSGDHDLRDALQQDEHPGMWGHRVLSPHGDDPFREVEMAGGVSSLLQNYGAMSLQDASGDLASFTGDILWSEMCNHLASETINRSSAEWAWSGA
jgi:hypothetical protein